MTQCTLNANTKGVLTNILQYTGRYIIIVETEILFGLQL